MFFNFLSGYCDENNDCNCSLSGSELAEKIREMLGGKDVSEYIKDKYSDFTENLDSWNIPTSRCSLDKE